MGNRSMFVGLDVHKETIDVSIAEGHRDGEVRHYGVIASDLEPLDKVVRALRAPDRRLNFVYEAGPCGFGIHRHLTKRGDACVVVSRSMVPKRSGDRVKTDRRDSQTLARLHRAGELRAIYVPDATDEAMRDLVRAREDAVVVGTQAKYRLKAFLLRQGRRYPGRLSDCSRRQMRRASRRECRAARHPAVARTHHLLGSITPPSGPAFASRQDEVDGVYWLPGFRHSIFGVCSADASSMPFNVGARRVVEAVMHSQGWRLRDPATVVMRFWGFLLVGAILYLGFVFQALGGSPGQLTAWTGTYLLYLIALEFLRARWGDQYDAPWLRGLRVLINVTAATWLLAVAPHGRGILWVIYFVPVFASILYFPSGLAPVLTVLASLCGLYLGAVAPVQSPSLTIWQYAVAASTIVGFAVAFGRFVDRLFTVTSPRSDIGRRLHQILDLDELVDEIVKSAAWLADADRALLIIVDPQSARYVNHAAKGFTFRDGRSVEELTNECAVLRKGERFTCADLFSAFSKDSLYARYFECRPRSVLAEPIFTKGGYILGVLNVTHDRPNRFDRFTQSLIREVSFQVAAAIENSLSYRAAQLGEARNQRISERLSSALREDDIVALVVEEAQQLVPAADGVALYRFDVETRALVRWKASPEAAPGVVEAIQKTAERTLTTGEPVLIRDTSAHPWFDLPADPLPVGSLVIAPFTESPKTDPMGALGVYSAATAAFNADTERRLTALGHQAALALGLARSKEQGSVVKCVLDEIQRIDDGLPEDELGQVITEAATRLLGFDVARLRVLDPASDQLVTVATSGVPIEDEDRMMGQGVPRGDFAPLLSETFRIERSYFIPHGHPVWDSVPASHFYVAHQNGRGTWLKDDALLTPLIAQHNETIGLLSLDVPRSGDRPHREHCEAIGVFASAAAWTIRRARDRRKLAREHATTQAFIKAISEDLGRCRDLKTVGDVVVQIGARLVNAEACTLYFVHDNIMELAHSTYLAGTEYIGRCKPISTQPGVGLTAWAAATGETLRFSDGRHEDHPGFAGDIDHRRLLPSRHCESLIIKPVRAARGEVVAILALLNKRSTRGTVGFDDEDDRRLEYLGRQVALTLDALPRATARALWIREGLEDDLHELTNWYHGGVYLLLEKLADNVRNSDWPAVQTLLPEVLSRALTTAKELKSLHTIVSSNILEETDFARALHRLVNAWSLRTRWVARATPIVVICAPGFAVPPLIANALLRIAASALANAVLHSGAASDPNVCIEVRAERGAGGIALVVKDTGFGMAETREGYGITRMRQLVGLLSRELKVEASIKINTALGAGTEVVVRIPLGE